MSLAEKGIPRLTPDKTEERSFDPRSSRPRGRRGRRSCLCPAAHSRYGARLRAPIAPKQRSSDRKDTQARERTSFASPSSSARSARGPRFGSINFVKMEDVSTEALARSAFVTYSQRFGEGFIFFFSFSLLLFFLSRNFVSQRYHLLVKLVRDVRRSEE